MLQYPLRVLGAQLGRTVTIVRLRSGELIIHSTAPFAPEDVKQIHALGKPSWLMDVTLMHDTCACTGRAAFPDLPYFVPEGFPGKDAPLQSLRNPPATWANEFEILPVEGMPRVQEYLCYHRPSRTLIVGDLVFNFGPGATPWTRFFFLKLGGVKQFPGISRLYRMSIRDREAFRSSMNRILEWDFDRVIAGHGDIIECGGKGKLQAALAAIGF